MKRKTRREKRTEDRVATSDLARVLRRRPSIRLFLVVVLANAVAALVPSVGCNSWRSLGRVDSQRGEYILEDQDADEIWRASKPEISEDLPNIRGKEAETYDVASDVRVNGKKSEGSFSERFKYMFRKPKSLESVPGTWDSKKVAKINNSSNYIKTAPARSETSASLSGQPDVSDSSRESFWSRLFRSSRDVPPDFNDAPKTAVEPRAGGLARDDAQNAQYESNQAPFVEQPTPQPGVRRRWSSRDPQNYANAPAAVKTQNDFSSPVVSKARPEVSPNVAANVQNDVPTPVTRKTLPEVSSTVATTSQDEASSGVAIKTRTASGSLLLQGYNSQSFLPPFDLIEQYYYPSGVSAETIPAVGTSSGKQARGSFRSSIYAPNAAVITDMSVSQVSYYQPQTTNSTYAPPVATQIQKSDAQKSKSQDDELLERRREFDWFDFAPSSFTPSEQPADSNFGSRVEEIRNAISADLSERYEEKTSRPRSADEILDESARRQREAESLRASKSVSYEEPTNEQSVSSNASTIGVDVSSFLNQTLKTNDVVAAVNSIDNRKSENASAPLTREEIEWVRHVEEAIQGLLTEREELKRRGEDTTVCDARLRLLYLVVGEYDRLVQSIADVDDPLKIFWEKECDGLETLLQNKLEEIDPNFVAETLLSGLESFFDVCDVQIRKALLVDTPACFGLYEERIKPYRPGEVVYAYAELDYVVSRETTRGHEIAVECRWRLLDSNGNALTEFKTQRCENVSETRLRDVVLNVAVPLSDEIAPNDYLLELEVVDLNARESVATTRRLNVKVVADAKPGARG